MKTNQSQVERKIMELDELFSHYAENHDEVEYSYEEWFQELFKDNDKEKDNRLYSTIKKIEEGYLKDKESYDLEDSFYELLNVFKGRY